MDENYAMIDLETLGVCPTSIVLTVGVIIFNNRYEILDRKFWVLDKKEQLEMKRTYCQGTIDFWKRQPKEAKTQFQNPSIKLSDFKKEFSDYIKKFNIKLIWSTAPVLDIGCLQTLYGDGDYLPWKYDMVRDVRTIRDYMKDWPERDSSNYHHDCLDDCEYQILCLQKSIRDMMFYGYEKIKSIKERPNG